MVRAPYRAIRDAVAAGGGRNLGALNEGAPLAAVSSADADRLLGVGKRSARPAPTNGATPFAAGPPQTRLLQCRRGARVGEGVLPAIAGGRARANVDFGCATPLEVRVDCFWWLQKERLDMFGYGVSEIMTFRGR